MNLKKRFGRIDRTQRLRYAAMGVGILALAPPVGFVAQWFGSATLCGNLCPRMAIGSGFVREVFSRPAGVSLLFVWLISTLFLGRWMCSHGCPVGGLTEFGSKLLPKRFKIDYSRRIDTPLFRYGFFAAYLVLPLAGMASVCCAFCNLSVIPEAFGAIFKPSLFPMLTTGVRFFSVIMYVGILGVLAADGRGHCHLVCPVGVLDSIMNTIGARLPFAIRERIQVAKCSGCERCAKACPTYAIEIDRDAPVIATIDYRRCNQCRICEGVCAKGAIGLGLPKRVEEGLYDAKDKPTLAPDAF